jgi:LysM repeat protein
MTDAERVAAGYPPPTRSGRRPAVSSTRAERERERDRAPQRERVQSDGPSWEQARRSEAYPTIKTRAGLGGLPSLPRVAVLAAALGVAALALFFLPALLGIGGGDEDASPSPSATNAAVTPLPSPTPEPEPTPQVYVIKTGDTLSKIAREFGLTLDQLLEANKDTIEDPDLIAVGDEIIIPIPPPDEVPGGSEEPGTEESIAP